MKPHLENAKNGAETVQFWFPNLWRVGLQAQSVVALPLQLRAIWEEGSATNGYCVSAAWGHTAYREFAPRAKKIPLLNRSG